MCFLLGVVTGGEHLAGDHARTSCTNSRAGDPPPRQPRHLIYEIRHNWASASDRRERSAPVQAGHPASAAGNSVTGADDALLSATTNGNASIKYVSAGDGDEDHGGSS